MAVYQRQIPGGPYVNETDGKQRQIPGGPYLNDTASAGGGGSFQAAWARSATVIVQGVWQMKKNVASQVIGAQMVSATDGSAFTGTVSCLVTVDAGTQGAGGGAVTHEGNGFHTYAPTQAETNGDHVAFTFTGTGAVPATIQVYTTFPQTGDNYARIGAPAGASVSADIAAVKTQTAAIEVDTGTDIPATLTTIAGYIDTEIAAVKSDTAAILIDTAEIGVAGAGLTALASQASVTTIDDFLDTEVAAIKAKTDSLTFTVAGKIDANVLALNGDTTCAANIERSTATIVLGTASGVPTTTSIPTSSLAPAVTVADQLKGRIVIFSKDTTTAALRGQATDITANTDAGVLTVTALTTAPVSGDVFTVT